MMDDMTFESNTSVNHLSAMCGCVAAYLPCRGPCCVEPGATSPQLCIHTLLVYSRACYVCRNGCICGVACE